MKKKKRIQIVTKFKYIAIYISVHRQPMMSQDTYVTESFNGVLSFVHTQL